MNENSLRYCVVAVCVITIGCVLIVALYKDINGALLGAGFGVIGTIMGYMFGIGKAKVTGEGSIERTNMLPVDNSNILVSCGRYWVYKRYIQLIF